jgi:hypothetical protein
MNFIRHTVLLTLIGMSVAAGFCCMMAVLFFLGFGHPNVITAEGNTYLGWWAMLFGSVTIAVTGSGLLVGLLGVTFNAIVRVTSWDFDTN